MQNQIFSTQIQRSLELTAKCFYRFPEKCFIGAGQIDQVIGVDHQWLEIVFIPQPRDLVTLRTA